MVIHILSCFYERHPFSHSLTHTHTHTHTHKNTHTHTQRERERERERETHATHTHATHTHTHKRTHTHHSIFSFKLMDLPHVGDSEAEVGDALDPSLVVLQKLEKYLVRAVESPPDACVACAA